MKNRVWTSYVWGPPSRWAFVLFFVIVVIILLFHIVYKVLEGNAEIDVLPVRTVQIKMPFDQFIRSAQSIFDDQKIPEELRTFVEKQFLVLETIIKNEDQKGALVLFSIATDVNYRAPAHNIIHGTLGKPQFDEICEKYFQWAYDDNQIQNVKSAIVSHCSKSHLYPTKPLNTKDVEKFLTYVSNVCMNTRHKVGNHKLNTCVYLPITKLSVKNVDNSFRTLCDDVLNDDSLKYFHDLVRSINLDNLYNYDFIVDTSNYMSTHCKNNSENSEIINMSDHKKYAQQDLFSDEKTFLAQLKLLEKSLKTAIQTGSISVKYILSNGLKLTADESHIYEFLVNLHSTDIFNVDIWSGGTDGWFEEPEENINLRRTCDLP